MVMVWYYCCMTEHDVWRRWMMFWFLLMLTMAFTMIEPYHATASIVPLWSQFFSEKGWSQSPLGWFGLVVSTRNSEELPLVSGSGLHSTNAPPVVAVRGFCQSIHSAVLCDKLREKKAMRVTEWVAFVSQRLHKWLWEGRGASLLKVWQGEACMKNSYGILWHPMAFLYFQSMFWLVVVVSWCSIRMIQLFLSHSQIYPGDFSVLADGL